MALLVVLSLVALATAPGVSAEAAVAGSVAADANRSVIAVSRSGLMHLDSSGTLLAWRPEAFQWWQAWHVATNPRNGTVCWVSAAEDQAVDGAVRCALLANLNQTWDLPQPRGLRVNSVSALAFDWASENWYVTESRVNYVCSYQFDRCLKLGSSGGNVRYFAAYDIPNRLLFRIATTGTGPYRLESLRLDGTGLRVLPTNLTYPAGLAVDPVRRHVYILDQGERSEVAVYQVSYTGEGKELVLALDKEGFGHSWRRSLDVVDGNGVVMWDDQKVVSTFSTSDGKKTDLVAGTVKGETIPALAKVEDLLAVKIFSPETQPDIENRCGDAECENFCIPTVVNDTADASCFCDDGLQLADLACREQHLLFAVVAGADTLQAVDLQTEEVATILFNATNITKLDFFWAGGEEFLLFWIDDGSLFAGRWLSGGPVSEVRRLVQASDHAQVLEIAVDWVQRHLLWMERDPSKSGVDKPLSVRMSPLDGAYSMTVMSDYWSEQSGMFVTTSGGLFTYAQDSWGDLEFVTREMTGAKFYGGFGGRGDSFLTALPAEVAVDHNLGGESWQDRFFWVDSDSRSVVFVHQGRLSGYVRSRLLTHPSLASAGGLDVLDTRLFWTERPTGRLWTADSETGGGVRSLETVTGGGALRLLHPWRQPPAQQPVCDQQRNGCSHFCLAALEDWEWGARCACPDGMQLGDDEKTCGPEE